MFEVKTEGDSFDTIIGRMHRLTADMQGKVMRSALLAGGNVIRKQARQNLEGLYVTPADERTGELSRRLRVKVQFGAREVLGFVFVHGRAYYGRFFELGTSRQPARPFLRPALIETANRVIQVAAKRLRDRIVKVSRQ